MLGISPSRKDDLESFLYFLIWIYKDLPWSESKFKPKTLEWHKMLETKMNYPDEILGQGGLENIVRYVRSLEFEEKPNYIIIREEL